MKKHKKIKQTQFFSLCSSVNSVAKKQNEPISPIFQQISKVTKTCIPVFLHTCIPVFAKRTQTGKWEMKKEIFVHNSPHLPLWQLNHLPTVLIISKIIDNAI
jgi:hypothetical protein